MDLNWWLSQVFVGIAVVIIVVMMQQKNIKALIWCRFIATAVSFIGFCLLGNISVIIMGGVGILRNTIALFFVYKPETNAKIKIGLCVFLALLLIVLNCVFWIGPLSIMSMVFGIGLILMFMQKDAAKVRLMALIVCVIGIVYFSLVFSIANIILESLSLGSAIVGIVRLDIKRNPKTVEEKP